MFKYLLNHIFLYFVRQNKMVQISGRNGRAAEGARLESVLTSKASRGFESLFLRKLKIFY